MANPDFDLLLTDEEVRRLSDLVSARGLGRTSEVLKLSRMTVLQILARQPARRGSVALARIGLAKAV